MEDSAAINRVLYGEMVSKCTKQPASIRKYILRNRLQNVQQTLCPGTQTFYLHSCHHQSSKIRGVINFCYLEFGEWC